MRKAALVHVFFALTMIPLHAARYFTGREEGLSIRPTHHHYDIATLIGETDHYDSTFYDDREVAWGGKPVLQYTEVDGVPVDFFYKVTDPRDLSAVDAVLLREKSLLDAASPKIFLSWTRYKATAPSYPKEDLYTRVSSVLRKILPVAPQKVLGGAHSAEEVDATLYQYLRSNGVSSLSELSGRPELVRMLVNKFYLLSTTYFYRDYPQIKAALPHLPGLAAQAKKEGRPLKLKVFACSTGEEVITYAVELLELGIKDFTVLATDINEPGLRHAEQMRYSYGAFERLSSEARRKMEKYFALDAGIGVWAPKDPALFKDRIRYATQDLLKPLPKDLEPAFSGPYDLVSILNVLFYLDDAAVQARKDSWADLLSPGGILVLHDFHYSVLAGSLGREWAAQRFQSLNGWVNLDVRGRPDQEKLRVAESEYREKDSQDSFLALVSLHLVKNRMAKAAEVCRDYLSRHPRSVSGWTIWVELSSLRGDPSAMAEGLERLFLLQPQSPSVLKALAFSEIDARRRAFLSALGEAQEAFMAGQRGRPEAAVRAFDPLKPPTEKEAALLSLLKANALSAVLPRLVAIQRSDAAEEGAGQAMSLLESAVSVYPESALGPNVLDMLLGELPELFAQRNRPDSLGGMIAWARRLLDGPWKGRSDFFVLSAGARLAHLEASSALAGARKEAADRALDAAASLFERALSEAGDLVPARKAVLLGEAGRLYSLRAQRRWAQGLDAESSRDEDRALALYEEGLSLNPLYGKSIQSWRMDLLRRREASRRKLVVPLSGEVLHFRDDYGPFTFDAETVRYRSKDGADIEATVLTPEKDAPKKPALVFVHMWARDRKTWWGLPEFLASHGYSSVSMDLRGHGNSRFPFSERRVTLKDSDDQKKDYIQFVRDVLPAVDRAVSLPGVGENGWILIGASLGVPVGVLAAKDGPAAPKGMVLLAPSYNYFGVDCGDALRSSFLREVPLYAVAEKTDASFKGGKEILDMSVAPRTFLQTENLGHGTDALYWDAGLPSIILRWLEDIRILESPLQRLKSAKPLLRLKK